MARKKATTKKKKSTKKKTRSSNGVNKSEAVRGQLRKDSNAKPKEIAATLNEQGINVEPAYVSIIKTKFNKGETGAGKRGRKGRAGTQSYDDLLMAKKFADQMGGIANARAAVDTLARLQ
jgi:hypothetical protein